MHNINASICVHVCVLVSFCSPLYSCCCCLEIITICCYYCSTYQVSLPSSSGVCIFCLKPELRIDYIYLAFILYTYYVILFVLFSAAFEILVCGTALDILTYIFYANVHICVIAE